MVQINQGLKPCPFCGGEADPVRAMGETWVRCMSCDASSRASSNHDHGIAAWNTRYPSTKPQEER
jgi:Lar family restriction alleviation protein